MDLDQRSYRVAVLGKELHRLLQGAQNAKRHTGSPVDDADFFTGAMLAVAAITVEAMPLDDQFAARVAAIADVFKGQLDRCAAQRLLAAPHGDGPRVA